MKLTAIRRTDEQAFAPVQADFEAPGGTIGRDPENRLVLADEPGAICRVQAVLRVSDMACHLLNLSGMGTVSVNGRPVTRDQEVVVRPGDEVAIGAYVLHAEETGAAVRDPEDLPAYLPPEIPQAPRGDDPLRMFEADGYMQPPTVREDKGGH